MVKDAQADLAVFSPEHAKQLDLWLWVVLEREEKNKSCLYSGVSDWSVTLIQAARGSELFVIHISECLISRRVCESVYCMWEGLWVNTGTGLFERWKESVFTNEIKRWSTCEHSYSRDQGVTTPENRDYLFVLSSVTWHFTLSGLIVVWLCLRVRFSSSFPLRVQIKEHKEENDQSYVFCCNMNNKLR